MTSEDTIDDVLEPYKEKISTLTAQLERVRAECDKMYAEETTWPHQAFYNDAVKRILAILDADAGEDKATLGGMQSIEPIVGKATIDILPQREVIELRRVPCSLSDAKPGMYWTADGISINLVPDWGVKQFGVTMGKLFKNITVWERYDNGKQSPNTTAEKPGRDAEVSKATGPSEPTTTAEENVSALREGSVATPQPAPQQPAAVEHGEQFTEQDRLEKKTRIKYQDIVYAACNAVDALLGGHTTRGTSVHVDDLAEVIRTKLTKRTEPSTPAPAAETGEPEWEAAAVFDSNEKLIGWGLQMLPSGGATREQAESALRKMQAWEPIAKWRIHIARQVDGQFVVWSPMYQPEGNEPIRDYNLLDAVLALAAQLEQGGAS